VAFPLIGDRKLSPREGAPAPWRRPFRPRRWALLLLLVAGCAVAADLFLPAGPFPPDERRVVLVQRGETLRGVAEELHRVGLLRGTLGFQALARLMHLDRSIKAGQYAFRLGISVPALLRAFARGMSGLNLITIPEGLTTSEISVLLSNRLGVPVAAFDSLAHDRAFLDSLGVTAPSIEGYLAPNSYEFLPGTSPEVAFRTMAARQHEVLLKASEGRDSLPLGLSLHQVLTLASIVEAEAQVNEERPRIARVYLNRLQIGMRLQADPTVSYGLGLGPRSHLFLRQLKSDSPFNTYMVAGLPPGPVCNPGTASIRAVIDPLPDIRDLYFVARGQGRHLFAETYQQHLKNIAFVRTASVPEPDPLITAHMLDSVVAPAPRVDTATTAPAHGAAHGKGAKPALAAGKTSASEKPVAAKPGAATPSKTTAKSGASGTESSKKSTPTPGPAGSAKKSATSAKADTTIKPASAGRTARAAADTTHAHRPKSKPAVSGSKRRTTSAHADSTRTRAK
jgi:peptidoglycan lytic transglycosylase G